MFNVSSVPQPGLGGRVSGAFAASVVGGGSTVNGMMFFTAPRADLVEVQWKAWAELGVLIQKEAAAGDAYGAFWTYRRSYARSGYYDPVASRKNLKIITRYRANEVLFSAKKHAESVTIQQRGTKQEIVLCAGWLHTPQVLQRCGLGPKDLLDEAGIKQIDDLPDATDLRPNHSSLYTNATFAAWAAGQWLDHKGPLSVGVGNSLSVPYLPQMSPNYKSIIAKAQVQNAAKLLPSTYTSVNVKGFVAQRQLLLKTFSKRNNGVV
ncbi:hypothetical protein VC83_02554 [Pseudogymnoascus destructans]|uniref:Glucose-methanol-choline oxidoreductase N-terminal domain-containing protein n=1 Tax=Pseudogymnoascus destructans TaxID=655981 RepID=A0A177AG96_9PEZI|nr:uncharacterized protein VC83_02554 [Pseudogymnoascus destructans]OAF61097.1 hypothetical protein VC83_02554 [Pseudogymnoascus destructans]